MNFLIAHTFTDSLAKLTGDEQKASKTTAFDMQINPANPGLSFHKLDKAKDKNFWSVRVSSDIRIIVHKTPDSLLLCYVDHHDNAYDWANRRKVETHPVTGAAQLVEIRETVQEIFVPFYVEADVDVTPSKSKPTPVLLFSNVPDEELLGYGVPSEWLPDVKVATENSILSLCDHLPAEASEALLEIATGGIPRAAELVQSVNLSPFEHPDAQRRFRLMTNLDELQQALDYPWDKWTIFLHPDQRELVEKNYNGPARVSGSAGTGKTIVALHRAAYLARSNPDARVLLTTYSDTLAKALLTKLKRLLAHEPRLAERIDVYSLNAIGLRLYRSQIGNFQLASVEDVRSAIVESSDEIVGHPFNYKFLFSEWNQVVDTWQIKTWQDYRDVARLGRKTRLPESQRALLWSIFERVHSILSSKNLMTYSEIFSRLAIFIENNKRVIFDFAVIDEAQDLAVSHLKFLRALGGNRQDSLFFAGDTGQRIFQQLFSWNSLGVELRGRSRTLRVNYRTSHQIRYQADRLLGPSVSDVDGNVEIRSDTISVFNGPLPTILSFSDESAECAEVGNWLDRQLESGVLPHEIGLFVRSDAQLDRAKKALNQSKLSYKVLDDYVETQTDFVSICTMHLAKGLEFKSVVVMACDDEIIPLQERIELVADDADLQEIYDTERQLLYVACTRARDNLLITSVDPKSEFIDDMIVK